MSKAYPSNLTHAQSEFLSDLIPAARTGWSPTPSRYLGSARALSSMFWLRECDGERCLEIFQLGRRSTPTSVTGARVGTWLNIHDRLHQWTRIEQQRHPSPSEAIIDSQSVKSAAMVNQAVGYDAGKHIKGRKRFMSVDTLGLRRAGVCNRRQCRRTRRG